ncbi:MAG: NADPH:quinone reductase [Burkholderiaceae bacterium]
MKAVWYDRQGPAREVLVVGEMDDPVPGRGEVRIRLRSSGINAGDLKKRQDFFGYGMPYPRVVPHSDGAGLIDAVGDDIDEARIGERVWCYGAQSYRAFGTAASCVTLPATQAVPLPDGIVFEQGACLGIPGITAHRAVHITGSVAGKTILVQGAAGAVGTCTVGLARLAGATVIGTARSEADAACARRAGAQHVLRTDGLHESEVIDAVRAVAADGVDHVVEIAFDKNISVDMEVLKVGGSIAAYATTAPDPRIPFWQLLFKNVAIHLVGSDDFSPEYKRAAALDLNEMLKAGWGGVVVSRTFPLEQAALAHEYLETRRGAGRVVLIV